MTTDTRPNQTVDTCNLPTSQKKYTRQNHPSNENTLTVNVQTERPQEQCSNLQKGSIEISPQPLKIEIQNSTDWPTVLVGCAGIISSIVIARYTSKVQSNQIKSNIANLRQRWIEELRECASKFMEQMTLIYNNAHDNHEYRNTPDCNTHYSLMLSAQIKFALMLDMKHEKNRQAVKVSEEIILALQQHLAKNESNEISDLGKEFETLVRKILEEAWQDIKSDLLGTTWYGRVLRSLTKSRDA